MEAICLWLRHPTSQSTGNVLVARIYSLYSVTFISQKSVQMAGIECFQDAPSTMHDWRRSSTGKVGFATEVNYLSKWATAYCMHLLCIQYFDRTRVDSCIRIKKLFDKKEISCLHDAIAVHDLHELSGIMCGCQTVTSVWYIPWVLLGYPLS